MEDFAGPLNRYTPEYDLAFFETHFRNEVGVRIQGIRQRAIRESQDLWNTSRRSIHESTISIERRMRSYSSTLLDVGDDALDDAFDQLQRSFNPPTPLNQMNYTQLSDYRNQLRDSPILHQLENLRGQIPPNQHHALDELLSAIRAYRNEVDAIFAPISATP